MAHPQPRNILQYATADFLTRFRPSGSPDWDTEERILRVLSPHRWALIEQELTTGPQWPVAVDLTKDRVVDGHRRVVVARALHLPQLLAVNAWHDTVWTAYIDADQTRT